MFNEISDFNTGYEALYICKILDSNIQEI